MTVDFDFVLLSVVLVGLRGTALIAAAVVCMTFFCRVTVVTGVADDG